MTEALHDLHMIQALDDMLHILPVRACNYQFGSTTVNQSVLGRVQPLSTTLHARALFRSLPRSLSSPSSCRILFTPLLTKRLIRKLPHTRATRYAEEGRGDRFAEPHNRKQYILLITCSNSDLLRCEEDL